MVVRVTDLTDREHLGIVIDNGQVQVQSVAPRQLQDVFNRVTDRAPEPEQANQ